MSASFLVVTSQLGIGLYLGIALLRAAGLSKPESNGE
jgi:hypothetical protein